MKLRHYGERAVLADVGDAHTALALRDALVGVPGIQEVVPGARTLLVRFDRALTSPDEIDARLASAETVADTRESGPPVDLPVRYDGADLTAVADELGLGTGEVISRHAAATYTVAFCGFAPGFAYLSGLDPALHTARLAEPRTAVPAGSVAVGGEFTGVYPRSSPGGWRLLGRTDAPLWDATSTSPALLTPGTSVRFVPS